LVPQNVPSTVENPVVLLGKLHLSFVFSRIKQDPRRFSSCLTPKMSYSLLFYFTRQDMEAEIFSSKNTTKSYSSDWKRARGNQLFAVTPSLDVLSFPTEALSISSLLAENN